MGGRGGGGITHPLLVYFHVDSKLDFVTGRRYRVVTLYF